jgi:hypothetical protein
MGCHRGIQPLCRVEIIALRARCWAVTNSELDWKEAQSAIYINLEAAITRASSLIETICKHILHNLNVELPNKEGIQELFKAASSALDLDPSKQVNHELKDLCSGLITVVQNLGTLRNKFGIAHGKDPAYIGLSDSQARLAVNAAGVAATFIMERWQQTKKAKQPEKSDSS